MTDQEEATLWQDVPIRELTMDELAEVTGGASGIMSCGCGDGGGGGGGGK